MTRIQRYWPIVLSGVCLAAALYFSFTNTAYILEGCPIEVYPEYGFLFIVAPAALIALVLAIKGAILTAGSRLQRTSVIVSVILSVLCVGLTVLFLWPTGSSCS